MKQVDTLTMNPAVDVSVSTMKVLPEEKLRCSKPSFEPGGGGINVSRVISKFGGSASPIVLAGGHSGKLLSYLLESGSFEPEVLSIKGTTRQNFTVFDKSSEVQYRFVMPGPEVTSGEMVKFAERKLDEEPQKIRFARVLVDRGSAGAIVVITRNWRSFLSNGRV